ncbi:multidrug effflux MFS transporter [Demequina gelatinilytica]|uniref:multidrug effflux MFS transporter n=1 Tax=Demequina gelatinilytica TaxID=1638980 RepID=UPI000B02577C|nr:multidrug effflux MFS transporter [Demequina gelatinilytica]
MSAAVQNAADQVTPRIVASPGLAMPRRQKLLYVVVLGALIALGPFTIDMYLPAFPAVAADLAASDAAIQLTLTATTIGFALGQLVVGPLSDALGRKKPLVIATTIHIAASLFVVLAPSVEWVMAGRVLQGIGAAGGGVVANAMVRDLFAGQALIRMLARMALVVGLAPVIAPVIGSQLLSFMDWRGLFVVLALYGTAVALVVSGVIKETMPAERRGKASLSATRARYVHLLNDRAFVGISMVGALTFAALFCYLSASSFVLQDQFGMSAQEYGLVFATNSVGLIIANQTSARLMRVFPPRSVITWGLGIMLTGAVLIVAGNLMGLGLVGLLVPLFFVVSSLGIIGPAVQITALNSHGEEAGTAASLLGALNSGIAGTVSPLVGVLGVSVISMGAVMIGSLVVAIAIFWTVVRPRIQTTVIA